MKSSHKVGGASLACISLACAYIQPWEGLWTTAKVDTIGTGRPVTWCYGETKGGAKVGDRFTPQQCSAMLAKRLPEYDAEIAPCIHVALPDKVRASLISGAYNAGSAAMCRSPMIAKMNAGDLKGGCEAFRTNDAKGNPTGWYIRAQGRIVKGLVNRRNGERKLCLEGINAPAPKPEPLTFWQKIKTFFLSFFKGN